MKKGHYITKLFQSSKTVFTLKEITLLWEESGPHALRERVSSYVKNHQLIRLRRGLYAKNKNYNKFEVATKILTPAYISFETVLGKASMIFQSHESIYIASYVTREVVCDNQTYSFKKLNRLILTDHMGIENKDGFSIATTERAFLDTLYINKDYYFDYLGPLDWDKVFDILPIYHNQRMNKKVQAYYQRHQESKI